MDTSKLVVIAGRQTFEQAREEWKDSPVEVVQWPEEVSEGGRLLEENYERGRNVLIVHGGDNLAGRVATAYWRKSSLGTTPLKLWPLEVDGGFLARQCESVASVRDATRLVGSRLDRWEQRRVGTVKVTASTEPAAWYGFSFGAGWVYRAAEARRRARGGAQNLAAAIGRLATETLLEDDETSVALRVTVDHEPRDSVAGSMVISTLDRTYVGFGVTGTGAMLWEGLSTSSLMRRTVTPKLLERPSAGGRRFQSVHLDTPSGWLLDGRLHGTEDSGVVQITPGPVIEVTWPVTGLISRLAGLTH